MATLVLVATLGFAFVPPAIAEEEEEEQGTSVGAGVELDFDTRYLWHGIVYNKGALSQPLAWVSAYDATLEVWNNLILHDPMVDPGWDETDLTVSYSIEWKGLGVEPSFSYFLYSEPDEDPATGMMEMRLSYALPPVEIYTSHAFDLVEYRGAYYGEAGLGWEGEVPLGIEVAATASLGWASARLNAVYAEVDRGALNLAQLGMSARYFPLDRLYVGAHAEICVLIDRALAGSHERFPANLGLVIGFES